MLAYLNLFIGNNCAITALKRRDVHPLQKYLHLKFAVTAIFFTLLLEFIG